MSEWKLIETCPITVFDRDKWYVSGERYMLWCGYATIGDYSYTQKGKGRWRNWSGQIAPTHWMPLPEPPK